RWQLPSLPPTLPEHVARIFGDAKLRHTHWVQALAYSPDGTRLATASHDGSVKLWEVATGRELRSYYGHSEAVRAVAFRPDGKLVASAGGDKEVRLWDPDTGKDVRTLPGATEFITSVAFSPDGTRVASASADR